MLKPIFRNLFFISIGLILLNLTNTQAQNINDALRVAIPGLGSNARALGMGNSYIGLSDDGSAAFFNPAGFGLLKRLEFTGGLSHSNYSNDVEFFDNNTSYSNSNTSLNRLSFAFPFPTLRGSMVFALSYHTTKDLTSAVKFEGFNSGNTSMIQDLNVDTYIPYDLFLTDSSFNSPFLGRLNQSGTILSDGDIHNWTFSGAVEIGKNLFIGLNLNIITGKYKSDNEYYEDDKQNIYQDVIAPEEPDSRDFQTFYLNRILDWDISGWDAKFGILYQLNNDARFGLTVQFPKTYNINEEFTVEGYSEFVTGFVPELDKNEYGDAVEYDITTPFELGAGFSYNIKGLILSAQGTVTDYSQIEFEDVAGLGTIAEDINRDIKDQLKSVISYNVGLEYTIPNTVLRIRGGFFVQPSPYQDDPSEFDRKYATAGLGFLTDETVGIDVAYAHGWWKDFGDNYGSDVSRTFQDITSDQFILTGIYRF
ncbi:MAG TPA: outer membrane protein transport protein [Ignavibacteriaceae bacterium]|nr:outer membrane protein transport protein [Ignavibacteriaceae bacterium]